MKQRKESASSNLKSPDTSIQVVDSTTANQLSLSNHTHPQWASLASAGTQASSAAQESKAKLATPITDSAVGSGFTSALFITPPGLNDNENDMS